MKKLLLAAATSATILSSSLAFAEMIDDNQWYLKLNIGATIFNKEKDKITNLKMKSNTALNGEIGVGSYFDIFRTDLTLGTVANGNLKKSGTVVTGEFAGTNGSVKHKPNITSLLVNGYVDFADLEMVKIFAGAGIGGALVKEKVSFTGVGVLNNNAVSSAPSTSTKNQYNFVYRLALGASAEVAEGVKAELAGGWTDYGKTKSKTVSVGGSDVKVGGLRYKGWELKAGVRFDI